MNINPGELNKKIQIMLEENTGQDEDGFPTNTEKVVRSCHAKVSYTSGKEIIQAGSEFSQAKKRFLVRYTPKEITTAMFVRYAGKDHNIVYVNPYGDSKEYLEIYTELEERNKH